MDVFAEHGEDGGVVVFEVPADEAGDLLEAGLFGGGVASVAGDDGPFVGCGL